MRTYLITGAAGFVGSHMVEHILKNSKDKVIGMDSLTYAGTWDRLRDVKMSDHPHSKSAYDCERFIPLAHDFRNPAEPNLIQELKEVTHVIHMGAESHVDHSITDPMRFVQANVVGTTNILNLARKLPKLELFIYFSTDEIFGPAPMLKEDNSFSYAQGYYGYKETDTHNPKNPYAATKSAGEQLVTSFANTYDLPCIITRQMNIIGERQHPEKFIPICISTALYGGDINIHATPDKTQAGLRHYIHARNVADAHMFLLNGKHKLDTKNAESFHIVGEKEVDNLSLAKLINEYVGVLADQKSMVAEGVTNFNMVDFHSSRPGHDLRYALDGSKMKSLGWEPPKTFEESLKKTISWTLDNLRWIN
jgi:dTDP-glucose 4,6-dehydratase